MNRVIAMMEGQQREEIRAAIQAAGAPVVEGMFDLHDKLDKISGHLKLHQELGRAIRIIEDSDD